MSKSSEAAKSPQSTHVIDARGLACPQPVVLVKKALDAFSSAGGLSSALLTVLVDNETARENVVRFATHSGLDAKVEQNADGFMAITISSTQETAPEVGVASVPVDAPLPEGAGASSADPFTVFFASDRIGQGDDELGALLMKGFIYALAESEQKPVRIIFMNSGVNLTVEGSIHLENLRRLQDEGVEILSCGTCLDFYGLKDKLAVGRISNMYEIVSLLSSGRVLRP